MVGRRAAKNPSPQTHGPYILIGDIDTEQRDMCKAEKSKRKEPEIVILVRVSREGLSDQVTVEQD